MSEPLKVPCPHCSALNRVPGARLADAPNCGRCGRPLFTAAPLVLDAGNFDLHATRSDLPLLVDFWAPWCGPCRMMAPHFEAAAAQLGPRMRLGKLDTQAEPALGTRFASAAFPRWRCSTAAARSRARPARCRRRTSCAGPVRS